MTQLQNHDLVPPDKHRGKTMQLNMDFVREILFAVEAKNDLIYTRMEFDSYSEDEIKKHLQALMDAGMIYAKKYGAQVYVSDLTWQGHDFLEHMRNPETWGKTKAALKKAGDWSIKTTLDIASAIIKAKVDALIKGGGLDSL